MKSVSLIAVLATLCAASANAGPEQIIKQRAKDLRDQNNARQGVPPPNTPPPRPPAPQAPQSPAPSPAVTAQQQAITKLKTDFAAFKSGSEITTEQKQNLAKDLSAATQGAAKLSQASVAKLANDLSAALSGKTLATADQTKLATGLAAILNGANLPATQVQTMALDVQSILQSSGVKRENALPVVNDLKAIAAELQKNPAKQ